MCAFIDVCVERLHFGRVAVNTVLILLFLFPSQLSVSVSGKIESSVTLLGEMFPVVNINKILYMLTDIYANIKKYIRNK